MTRRPASTYRLQIRQAFDLDKAAEVVPYLRDLGVDWAYLSPLLAATEGSDHGYDVVDASRVDDARGGPEGLERFAAAARAAGLGILIDIVPNHMGVADAAQNPWWWDLLAKGRASRYAAAFDVDWDFGGGRIRLPVLGTGFERAVDAGELRIEGDELHYFDHRFPLAAGSVTAGERAALSVAPVDGQAIRAVHDRQHYELMEWRRESADLNYRRFFAVSSLAGIRVEDPEVFGEAHAEILRWMRSGLADGLRIDHPDGLADPVGYLDRLAEATGGAYVLVEKILEHGEVLPQYWATDGTTGYDAMGEIDRVFVDPAGKTGLDRVDAAARGGSALVWADLIHDTKRGITDSILRSEVLRLDRLLDEPVDASADAIAELLTCFPVYRSYLPDGREHLDHAVADARRRRPDLAAAIDHIAVRLADPAHPMAVRFQQTSGMVMAKGVEDTAFYRYTRLGTLTEVGGDPTQFALEVADFHDAQQRRLASRPHAMTSLSTHDTKRGEDVRARISVLAELPEEWAEFLRAVSAIASSGHGAFDNLLWQAIVGAWPASRKRLHAYAEKAAREAGEATTWLAPDPAFEQRMHAVVDAAFDDEGVTGALAAFAGSIERFGWSNSLGAKLLQLTGPGVPDVYQGSELWERSLVDPDNRRPVDFDERRRLLERVDAGWLPSVDATGAAKLLVTSRALRLRRDRPELFTRYLPMTVTGRVSSHAIAVDRGGVVAVATRLPAGLAARGGWGDTLLLRRARPAVDVLTGHVFEGREVPLAELLARYPVALLAPIDAGAREERS
ncbi:MAG TPA: malto-oligosyltrehalose synthase [Microbacterium sp.]|uniref:malto-oligosyltrehalose synthase n=1 Tax=Microbacterium sp. TaxID=51671 RepID=UPI002B77571E|nr:malto-oligosyltrehalose synthase [Microbacterium sp.]HWI32264.1 malto-oligosyltrehalose synthase [Microbacterium sp.]